jgi:ubiquinol-cytochrome c reductase cytochrome b subunit
VIPFIDRKPMIRVTKRVFALGVVLLSGIGWGALTMAAVHSTPPPSAAAEIDFASPTDWMKLSPVEMAGVALYRHERCATCHNIGGGKQKLVGPDLANVATRHNADWTLKHFKRPQDLMPGTSMPAVRLSDAQLNWLTALMLKLTPANGDAVEAAPDFVTEGALLFETNHCNSCHQVNGVGMKVGPVLNGLSTRRSEQWVEDHFVNPQKLAPGTIMPPYRFGAADMHNMVGYLFTLPE